MQIHDGEPPGPDSTFTRRTALSGLLAAVLTPTLLDITAESQALAAETAETSAVPIPRADHSTTLMTNGTLLVAGGFYYGTLSAAQIFSLGANSWSNTGSMITPRARHAAAIMADGHVLVCGGINRVAMSHAEIYDPATGIWSTVAPMNIARYGHTATLINGGVLVYGGENQGPTASPELFDGRSWTLLSATPRTTSTNTGIKPYLTKKL